MRAWVRLLIGAVLAMGAAVTAPAPVACACSCKGFSTAEALDAASAVFGGEVISTTGLCAAPVKLDVTVLGAGVRPSAVPPATPSEITPTVRAPEQTPTPAGAPDRLLPGLATLAVVLAVGAATVLLVRRPRS